VAVCPTGIDIRNGTQLECIGCANCVDACDEVMDKLGQSRGLIRYDSLRGVEEKQRKFFRPRLILYAVLLLAGLIAFTIGISARVPFEANVIRPQGTPFAIDGDVIRNTFQVHLVNKQPQKLTYVLDPAPLGEARILVPIARLELDTLEDRQVPLIVEVPRSEWRLGLKAELRVRAEGTELERVIEIPLQGPAR
jgi:polyferredoxin